MAALILSVTARGTRFTEAPNMATVLIGIDDTDNCDSPGTGKLGLRLTAELVARGAVDLGMTAHQLLIDDRIPYTGHNRAICLGIGWGRTFAELDFAAERIASRSAEGSDPGICIAAEDAVSREIMSFGRSALVEVLEMQSAVSLAGASSVYLRPLGGSGQGIVGALASVGLRADGNFGRFTDLPGLRDLGEFTTIDELGRLGISVEHSQSPRAADAVGRYKTMNWVRPRLVHGKPVWRVEWSDEHDAWISVDRKKIRTVEQS
jgi:hypothetical protein